MLALGLLSASPSVFALDPSLALSQYAKRHWQVEDGLPQNYITSLTQTPDGYLLAGTSGGVVRFDGSRFTPVPVNPQAGVSREWITAVRTTPDGVVWIATRDAGLFRSGLPPETGNRRFDGLLVTKAGGVLGVGGLGLSAWRANRVDPLHAGITPADPSWDNLLEHDGAVLVASNRGLLRWASGKASTLLPPDSPQGLALALTPARENGLWVGTSRGLYRMQGEMLSQVPQVPGPVVSIVEDRDGVVWAATWGMGLFRIHQRRVERWSSREGLPDDFVHNLLEDSEGNLWIGSRGGLSRWKTPRVVPYGRPEGLDGQFFSTVTGSPEGDVWMGTWRSGISHYRDGRIDKLKLPVPDLNFLARAMAAGPGGRLFVAGWGRLYERTQSGWLPHAQPRDVHALLFDGHGQLWMGASDGLWAYPETTPRIQSGPVKTLLADANGQLWIGADDGLSVLEHNVPRTVGGLPHPSVTSLSQDSKGRVWVTTRANGVTLIDGGKLRHLDRHHGLPDLPFYALADDGAGSLWLSSPAGIFEIPVSQVDEFAAGTRRILEPVPYYQDDGMRTIECQNVGFPSCWKDREGALWFPTVRGMVRIKRRTRQRSPELRVVIESASAGARSHRVGLTAPRLGSAARVEFRYRLDGGPAETIPAGAERAIHYSGLPSGDHLLRIAARERGEEWGPETEITLHQPPRFWETWWFRILALAAMAAALTGVYRWRVFLLKGRYRAVLAERNRIAREWHDTLLAGFSAINWQLDTTLRRLRERPEAAGESVETAQKMVQHYRTEARRVIWDLRSTEPELESLAAAVQASVEEATEGRGIAANVRIEGEPHLLPGDVSQNLLRICQEALANAIRHGHPKQIDVTLSFAADQLALLVRDDGAGFETTQVPAGHFGLEIIRERARNCGGSVTIASRPGEGTSISASFPRGKAIHDSA